ncbi:MAG: ABC transporter permease, partial [Ruminiclostridium sp.]
AGIVYACMMRESNPVELLGTELAIIAAVVLGGTRITGGHGTITGTFLGLFLIAIIKNNLILMGISTYWQTFTIGLMILLGTGITAYQVMRAKYKVNNELA